MIYAYSLDAYQLDAWYESTDGDTHFTALYLLAGMTAELGEVASLFERAHRKGPAVDIDNVKLELGDLLWNLSCLARLMGLTLSDVAHANIEKLIERGKSS